MSRVAQRARLSRGAPAVTSMSCPGCRAENLSTARFCAACGAPLDRGVIRRHRLLLAGLILAVAAVVFAAHWPALTARAISFDDTMYLTDNPLVRNPSWSSARQFL